MATKLKNTSIPWIPQVPEHWELVRLKYLFDFTKKVVGKDSPNYDILSLTTKGVIKRDLESGMGKFPSSFDGYQIITPDTLLLCLFDMDVTPRIVGHVSLTGITSSAYTSITPKKNVFAKYFYYYFLNQDRDKTLLALGTGIRITLREDVFGGLMAPLPPYEEQNAIVEYLDKKNAEIDKFISNKERLVELLEARKIQNIEKLVTNGTNKNVKTKSTGNNLLGEVPEHWKVKKIRYCSKLVKTGTTPSGTARDYFENGTFNWFTPGDFSTDLKLESSQKKVVLQAIKNKEVVVFPKDSILIIGIGGTLGKVGIISEEGSSNQQINAVVFNKEVVPYYGLYILWLLGKNLIKTLSYSALPILNQNQTKDLLISIPPIEEQILILAEIKTESDKIDSAISKAQAEISAIKEYRESLITDLVLGKRSFNNLSLN